jgi:hypothetical protein
MGKCIDLAGKKFGFLEVLRRGENYSSASKMARWICKCFCGNECLVGSAHLRSRIHPTKSCGCLKLVACRIHGFSGKNSTSTYRSWTAMRDRCRNCNSEHFKDYGGRGITICEKWDSFSEFLKDMGERPKGTTLDRINNDGNYEFENCRWASQSVQVKNQRHRKLITNFSDDEIIREYNRRFQNGKKET